jgi:hypothetical protein
VVAAIPSALAGSGSGGAMAGSGGSSGAGCSVHTDAVLAYLGFSSSYALSMAALLGYWLGLHVLSYAALRAQGRRERR